MSMRKPAGEMLTITEVAAEYGVTQQTVYQAVRQLRLKSYPVNKPFSLVKRSDATAYFKRTKGKAGRPRKS